MPKSPRFTDAEWETLKAGPLHMLSLVGAADSHVDAKEWSALIHAVGAAAASDDELVNSVMSDLATDLGSGAANMQASVDPGAGLRAIASVLDGHDGGTGFRRALLEIGGTIAESSGAQLTRTFNARHGEPGWVRSAGTSAMEREALAAAAEALGLN